MQHKHIILLILFGRYTYIYYFCNKEQKSMTYGIIGTGAIGGYYGAKMAKAGNEVHFLFRSDYKYVRAHGLQVNSCNGSFHLDDINAYCSTKDMPKCDVVLVCLKTTANKHLSELLPPLLKEDTVVILIQNGIGVEDDVQKMFPDVQLAAGLAFICSAKTEPGVVDHQDYGQMNIGNYSASAERIESIIADFNNADIKAAEVNYKEARWRKAVWNMPFNGLTVALNTQTNKLLQNSSTRSLVREMMMEVVNAAQADGVENLREDFVEKMLDMTDNMRPYSPSMKLDYDFHRPMEIEYIYTRPTQIAEQVGCPMHKLKMLEEQLRFIESQK